MKIIQENINRNVEFAISFVLVESIEISGQEPPNTTGVLKIKKKQFYTQTRKVRNLTFVNH